MGFSFADRWGEDVISAGVSTFPTTVAAHMGELDLTNGEFTLFIQVATFKLTGADPFPKAATLAARMNTTVGTIHNLTQSLREKGYLIRKCLDEERGVWSWDFSGLLQRALEFEVERGATSLGAPPPTPRGAPEIEVVQETEVQQPNPPPKRPPRLHPKSIVVPSSLDPDSPFADLLNLGMNKPLALRLGTKYGPDRTRHVVAWIHTRYPNAFNPVGLARKALEEDWNLSQPPSVAAPCFKPFKPLPPRLENQDEINQQGIQSVLEVLRKTPRGLSN